MKIELSRLEKQQVVLITIEGDLTAADMNDMRRRTIEEADATGYGNFLVDIRQLRSIEGGNTYATFDLGEQFSDIGFSVWANTAVLMPDDDAARRQAEFLHTVEINRGRGVLNYVESFEEAFTWFEEMAKRR